MDLLKPRYKVIADFPGNRLAVGGTYTFDKIVSKSYDQWIGPDGGEVVWCAFKDYPNLFKLLEWWEERQLSEMPQYVKYSDISRYFPVDIVCKGSDAPFSANGFTADGFLPATEEEYNAYLQSKGEQEGGRHV